LASCARGFARRRGGDASIATASRALFDSDEPRRCPVSEFWGWPPTIGPVMQTPVDRGLESIGSFLLAQGLGLTIILALLGLIRTHDNHAEGFILLCLISYAMLFTGYRLLVYVGAWPVR